MRLEQLEYLVAISKSSSLNEASKKLYVSQQSLGKAIKNLEDELHTVLIMRTHNGCHLTPEGEEVLANAKDILRQVNDMKTRYRVCPEVDDDLVVICCPSVHQTILPEVVDCFSERLPQVKVTTLHKDSLLAPDLHRRLQGCDSEIIMSVIAVPAYPSDLLDKIYETGLTFKPLIDDRWVACVNKKSKLASKANITVKDLIKEPIVVDYPDYPERGIDRVMLEYFAESETVNVKKTVDDDHLMYSIISGGNYVGFASHFFTLHSKHLSNYPNIEFRSFAPTIHSKIGLLYDAALEDNLIVKTFTDCLEENMTA